MLREYEEELVKRYKHYYSKCLNFSDDNYDRGHTHEISWILHTLFGYSDREIIDIEEELKIYVASYH